MGAPIALALGVIMSAAACDVTVNVPLTCSVVGPGFFTQRIRTNTFPDRVSPGGQVHLDLTVGWVQGRGEGTVTRAELTLPLPNDVASVDAVAFEGDDLTGAWTVVGRHLIVTYTGAADQLTVEMPTVKLTATLAADARSGSMEWRTVSAWSFETDQPSGHFQGRCVPTDPGTVLNNTHVG